MKQIIPSGISSVYALHGGPERAMKQIFPSGISRVYALNSGPERDMKQIIPSVMSSVYALRKMSLNDRETQSEVKPLSSAYSQHASTSKNKHQHTTK